MTHRFNKVAAFAAALGTTLVLSAAPIAALAQANTLSPTDLGTTQIEDSGLKLGTSDIRTTAGRIINVALGFLGIIAVVIVLLGGFKYMIAGGNEEKTSEAKKLIVSGIIGLAIILSAWAITSFVITNLVNATQSA